MTFSVGFPSTFTLMFSTSESSFQSVPLSYLYCLNFNSNYSSMWFTIIASKLASHFSLSILLSLTQVNNLSTGKKKLYQGSYKFDYITSQLKVTSLLNYIYLGFPSTLWSHVMRSIYSPSSPLNIFSAETTVSYSVFTKHTEPSSSS